MNNKIVPLILGILNVVLLFFIITGNSVVDLRKDPKTVKSGTEITENGDKDRDTEGVAGSVSSDDPEDIGKEDMEDPGDKKNIDDKEKSEDKEAEDVWGVNEDSSDINDQNIQSGGLTDESLQGLNEEDVAAYEAWLKGDLKEDDETGPKNDDQRDFLEKNNLKITPQGSFEVSYGIAEGEKRDIGEAQVLSVVSIDETTEGAKIGFKKVIARFEADLSGVRLEEGQKTHSWVTAFDRYTGTCFECGEDYRELSDEGFIRVYNIKDNYSFEVKVEFEARREGKVIKNMVTVTCPEWYDGTVFQRGYYGLELEKQNNMLDSSERLYTIDEMATFDTNGHTYSYFSYKDR